MIITAAISMKKVLLIWNKEAMKMPDARAAVSLRNGMFLNVFSTIQA